MARCANCSAMIIAGGSRDGDDVYCNDLCRRRARAMVLAEEKDDVVGFREMIRDLREDVSELHAEVARQRQALSQSEERLDFVERAMVQLRNATQSPPAPRS